MEQDNRGRGGGLSQKIKSTLVRRQTEPLETIHTKHKNRRPSIQNVDDERTNLDMQTRTQSNSISMTSAPSLQLTQWTRTPSTPHPAHGPRADPTRSPHTVAEQQGKPVKSYPADWGPASGEEARKGRGSELKLSRRIRAAPPAPLDFDPPAPKNIQAGCSLYS